MRLFLLPLFLFFGFTSSGQFQIDCITASSNINVDPAIVAGGNNVGGGDEGDYTPASLTTYSTVFFAFQPSVAGFYDISVTGGAAAPVGTVSVGLGANCAGLAEAANGTLAASIDVSTVCLAASQTYFLVLATEAVDEGDIDVSFTFNASATNDDCINAIVVNDGDAGHNTCAVDGLVWYQYTVGNGEDIDISVTSGTLGAPVINQVLLNSCAGPDVGTMPTCLNTGDVLFIEVGDATPNYGDYTINISDVDNGIPNEDCASATPQGTVNCTGNMISGNGDPNACQDLDGSETCHTAFADGDAAGTDGDVWYTFDVDPGVHYFTVTGSEFEVFTGTCGGLTPLAGGSCDNISAFAPMTTVTTTYYVRVSNGGSFTAQSGSMTPSNDNCGTPGDPTGGTGSTSCATAGTELGACGASNDHVVYFSYMTGAASSDLTISVSGTGTETGATDLSMIAMEADCATALSAYDQINNTATSCNNAGDIVLSCVPPNTDIRIAVGSADNSEGDFNISVTEVANPIANDICSGASDVTPPDCMLTNVPGDNTGSCPEASNFGSSCDLMNNNIIWYSINLPANGIGLDFENLAPGTEIAVFSGSCAGLASVSACINANTEVSPLAGGQTYYLAVGQSGGGEGSVSFDVLTIVPAANDMCANAEALANGTPSIGTTACATADPNGLCGVPGPGDHTVYYSYTTGATSTNVSIVVALGGGGNPATDIGFSVTNGCTATLYDNTLPSQDCGPAPGQMDLECVPPNTSLIIAVSSIDGSEGDFTITLTDDNSTIPANDLCSAPIDITPPMDCVFNLTNVDNTNACPETFGGAACDITTQATTWYAITLPANAVGLEFINIQANLQLILFDNGCPLPIIQQDCFSADTEVLGLTGGSSYLIAATTVVGNEGPYTFEVKTITPPDNDQCANAEIVASGATLVMETTECATSDFTNGCPPDQEQTVWYSYTPSATDKEVVVDISNYTPTGGGAANYSVLAFADCAGTLLTDAMGMPYEHCGGDVPDELTIVCPDPGVPILIMVSSSGANEGTFDITITGNQPTCAYTNDDCADAIDASTANVIVTDDPCITISGCNDLACDDAEGACAFPLYNVVYYTFTTDANATDAFVTIDISNGEGGELDAPTAILLDACGGGQIGGCAAGAGGAYNSGPLGGIGVITANTTYIIAVANTDMSQNGGTFDLCVEVTSGCVNDVACDAITLTSGVPESSSTVNCTQDAVGLGCGQVVETSSAWFSFEIQPGEIGVQIDVTGVTIPGEYSVNVGVLADCTNPDLPLVDAMWCMNSGDFSEIINCLFPGVTYYIQVSSRDDPNQGDFDITFTGLTPNDLGNAANDLCENAELIDAPDCELITVNGQNIRSCPENLTGPSCPIDTDHVVWHQITLPPNALGIEFSNITGGAQLLMLDGACPPTTIIEDCFTTDTQVLSGPGTYNIAVSLPGAAEGVYSFDVLTLVPPVNDSPCDTDMNPPIDLSGGGSHAGTTCCAIGANDDPGLDFANAGCSGASDDDAVWYTFTPDGVSDGIQITVSGGSIGSNMAVEIYTAPPGAGCAGPITFQDSECGSTSVDIGIPSCIPPGEILYVKVTSAASDCGTFDITIADVPSQCAPLPDECDDASTVLMPGTDPSGGTLGTPDCQPGCLEFACPETTYGDCGQNVNPTVWYQVMTDTDAAQMFIDVTPMGSWSADFVVYEGTSCADLSPVGNFISGSTCAQDVGGSVTGQFGVSGDLVYWIAISASGDLDDPGFEICATTTVNLITCLAPNTTEFTVDIEPVGGGGWDPSIPINQLCSGQTYNVCMNFFYDASASGADWLHGVIPQFGSGWDITSFDPNAAMVTPAASTGPGGQAVQWFPENTTTLQEGVPNICTFVNSQGFLEICNELVQSCAGVCAVGMTPGEFLPGGWFWLSTGGNAGCTNNGIPETMWGIGSVTADVNICFDITVREFDTEQDCLDNNDLQISLMPFSDGIAGCWEDPTGECGIDYIQFVPILSNCDFPPDVIGDGIEPNPPVEICTGSPVNANIMTDDGSVADLIVTYDPLNDPRVTGATPMQTFTGGSGIITDVLTNNTCDPPEAIQVRYIVEVNDGGPCPRPGRDLWVIVYPKLTIDGEAAVCQKGQDALLTANVIGGSGVYTQYDWAPDPGSPAGSQFGNDYIVNQEIPPGTYTYSVTVSDSNTPACTGVGQVTLTVHPAIDVLLNIDVEMPPLECITGCTGAGNSETIEILQVSPPGTVPNIDWQASHFGIVGSIDPSQMSYTIDYENTFFLGGGQDFITLVVTDFSTIPACEWRRDIEIKAVSGPELVDLIVEPDCSDGTATIQAQGQGAPLGSFGIDYIALLDPGMTEIDRVEDMTQVSFNVDMSGIYTLVIADNNGCTSEFMVDVSISLPTPPVFDGDEDICEGESATITITNDADYISIIWDNAETDNSITVSPTTTTSYVVTVTNSDMCTSIADFEVEVNANPVVSFSGATTYCPGTSTSINAGGDATWTYMWSGPAIDATNEGDNPVSINMPGTYSVTVTDSNMCSATDMIEISEDASISVTVSGSDICDTGSTMTTLDAGLGFDSYQWQDGGVDIAGETGQTLVVSMAGMYTVTVTQGGCNGSGTYNVNLINAPTATITEPAPVCNEDNGIGPVCVDFTAQVSGSTGVWSNPNLVGVDISDPTNVCFDGLNSGSYCFTFTTDTATDPCVDQAYEMCVTVEDCVCPDPTTLGISDICDDGQPLDLTSFEGLNTDDGDWSIAAGPAGFTEDVSDDTFDPSGQPAGMYTLEFTVPVPMGSSCVATSQQMFNLAAAVNAQVGVDTVICNATVDGSVLNFNNFVVSGNGDWTFTPADPNIDMADLSAVDFNGATPGAYVFRYTTNDAVAPCVNNFDELTVLVRDCSCPDVTTSAIQDLCAMDETIIDLSNFEVTSEAGTWFYEAGSGPQNPLIMNDMFDPNGLLPGTYTVFFMLDAPKAGCPDTTQQHITVVGPPSATVATQVRVCTNNPVGPMDSTYIDFNSLVTAGDLGGVWTEIGVSAVAWPPADLSNVSFFGVAEGMYTFRYTTTSGMGMPCDDVFYTLTVTVADCACPSANTLAIPAMCDTGNAIDLTIYEDTSETGTWSYVSGSGPQEITINGNMFDPSGLMAGSYTVRFTIDNMVAGCTPFTDQVIVVNAEPSATLAGPQRVCSNMNPAGPQDSTFINFNSLVIAGDMGGTWIDVTGCGVNLSDLSNVSFVGVPVGTCTFQYVTNSAVAPCTDQPYTIDINVEDCTCPSTATSAIPDICNAGNAPIDLTTFVVTSESGSWSFVSGPQNVTITNDMFDPTGLIAGAYIVEYVLDNQVAGCPPSSQQTIVVEDQPDAGIGGTHTLCQGENETVDLSSLLTNGDAGGMWIETSVTPSTGGAFDATAGTFDASNQIAGTYTFSYNFMVAVGSPCQDAETTVEVIIEGLPTADAGADDMLTCTITSVTLGGTGTSSGNGITYLWTEAGGASIDDPTAPMISVSSSGTYQLLVTDTNTNCTATDEVIVDVDPSTPTMTLVGDDPDCFGDTNGSITATNITGGSGNYEFSIDGGATWQSAELFGNLAGGDYTVLLRDDAGCTIMENISLEIPQSIFVEASSAVLGGIVQAGEPTDLTIMTNVPESDIMEFSLTRDEVLLTDVFATTISVIPDPNLNVFVVTIVDINGCVATDEVVLDGRVTRNVYFPTVISSNAGNSTNQFFFPGTKVDEGAVIEEMLIFDRWGEIVFSNESFLPNDPTQGWDGTFKKSDTRAERVEEGVYVWLVRVLYLDGATETYTGDVTILH